MSKAFQCDGCGELMEGEPRKLRGEGGWVASQIQLCFEGDVWLRLVGHPQTTVEPCDVCLAAFLRDVANNIAPVPTSPQ